MDEAQDFLILARKVKALTGIDLSSYKPNQMHRRLGSMMARRGCQTFSEYAHALESDPDALKQFVDKVTINVSELFRNPEKFDQLESEFMQPLVQKFGALSVWSAGCSYGAEIYSVVIQLEGIKPGLRHRYLATDIDMTILARARVGEFNQQDVRGVTPQRLQKYFVKHDDSYTVSADVRSKVEFKKQDLLQAPFPSRMHLILCRNVVIYFTDEAKDQLYRRFYEALVPGGVLFVGGTERIPNSREIGFITPKPFFYAKPETEGNDIAQHGTRSRSATRSPASGR